jgi:hypothetical protein
MRLPRFKIRSLLGVVFLIAIAIAALRAADESWDSGMLGLTLLSLMTAVLLAVHRTDRRRAYWLGFALFGSVYLVATLIPSIGSRLPTTKGLAFIDSKMPGRQTSWVTTFLPYLNSNAGTVGTNTVQGYVFTPQVNDLSASFQKNVWIWDATTGKLIPWPGGTTENFLRIGHSLLSLLLAFVGGRLSRCLYGQGRGQNVLSHRESATSP